MELPIPFPSDADVIREEVARFRALTAEEKYHSVCSLLNAGESLMIHSQRYDQLRKYSEQQEELSHHAFCEAVKHHVN